MFFQKRNDLPSNLTSYDLVKFAALIIMIIDHTGAYFFHEQQWWRVVGRAGLPVWFFLAGYAKNKSIGNSLIVGSLILVCVNVVFGQYLFPANALVSIIIVRLVIDRLGRFAFLDNEHLIIVTSVALLLSLPSYYAFEYGTLAILLALFGYSVRNKEQLQIREGARKSFIIFVVSSVTFLQIVFSEFTLYEGIGCAIGMAFFSIILANFRSIEYSKLNELLPHFMSSMIAFGGRYTLEIYIIHLTLFKIAMIYMHHGFYSWFHPTWIAHFPS